MSNYNIENLARNMGFNDNYINKLNAANQFISESANKDRDILNSQLNQTLSDYERERQKQNNEFIKEGQAAYVDYAKAINPYSSQSSNSNRIGLGNSGYAESSLIGANNTYQNRYTNTKTNYDNIFANINNNIAKAKETNNIELAKIAKQEQERMLENLYKINDEYVAEKQREEEKRRWEAEMALQRQVAANSKSTSSSGRNSRTFRVSKSSSGNSSVSFSNSNNTISDYAKSVANNLLNLKNNRGITGKVNNAVLNQSKSTVASLVNSGKLNQAEANYIFNTVGL